MNAATREGLVLGLMEEARDFRPLLMDLDDLYELMKQKNPASTTTSTPWRWRTWRGR